MKTELTTAILGGSGSVFGRLFAVIVETEYSSKTSRLREERSKIRDAV
jgi:hypothetical protein